VLEDASIGAYSQPFSKVEELEGFVLRRDDSGTVMS